MMKIKGISMIEGMLIGYLTDSMAVGAGIGMAIGASLSKIQ